MLASGWRHDFLFTYSTGLPVAGFEFFESFFSVFEILVDFEFCDCSLVKKQEIYMGIVCVVS